MPNSHTIQPDAIRVVGRGTNVDFSIDDSVPFDLAERRLREYLSQCRGLYSRGRVSVNVGRRILAPDQLASIKNILGCETGLTVSRYWCPPDVLSTALAGPDSRPALPSPPTVAPESPVITAQAGLKNNGLQLAFPGLDATQSTSTEIDDAGGVSPSPAHPGPVEGPEHLEGAPGPKFTGNQALIIKHTCRSGEVVRYQGDVVVFGDVNPGAEIVADGDIVVLGSLRGTAHAGADGDLKATIFALNLESHRLQIGSCVGERPHGTRKGKSGRKAVSPQIAYLSAAGDHSIFVAPFDRSASGGREYQWQSVGLQRP